MPLMKLLFNLFCIVEFLRNINATSNCLIHEAEVLCGSSSFSHLNISSLANQTLPPVHTLHLSNAYYSGVLLRTTRKLVIEDYPYATLLSPFSSTLTLNSLNIDHTRLKTFPSWLCTYNRNLSSIEMDYSLIEQILEHDLHLCINLYILRITHSNLRQFTSASSVPVHAQYLYLNNNNFTEVSNQSGFHMYAFPSLHILDLSSNRIETIALEHFSRTPSLTRLDLSDNRLRFFGFGHLSSLAVLDLRGNPLLDVDMSWHSFLPHLTEIYFPYAHFCCQWKSSPEKAAKKSAPNSEQHTYVVSFHVNQVCSPSPDPMTPCESLLASRAIRLLFLLIVGISVSSNLTALIIPIGRFVISSYNRWSISTLFSSNLALADLISSLYLILVWLMDLHFRENFHRSTQLWMQSYSCSFIGFIYMVGIQSSIYALALLTFERFYTILFSFKRQTPWPLKFTLVTIAVGWLTSLIIASLPLININSFHANALCVPFRMETFADRFYLSMLMIIDLCFLSIIIICNGLICFNFSKSHVRTLNDARATVKILSMVLLVCISRLPLVIYICLTLTDHPSRSLGPRVLELHHIKLLILFLQPFSACFNPFMYSSLSTLQWTSATTSGFERPKPASRPIRLSQLRSKSGGVNRGYYPLRMMSITSLDYRCSSLPETP
jgi:Leucine-rich repeat (LRR) protein